LLRRRHTIRHRLSNRLKKQYLHQKRRQIQSRQDDYKKAYLWLLRRRQFVCRRVLYSFPDLVFW
jgi:hypothetical protein